MLKLKTTKHLTDLEVLEWFNDQTYLWREKVWEISKAKSLQGVVDFLRKNFDAVSKLNSEDLEK